jgi:hypothetical protein
MWIGAWASLFAQDNLLKVSGEEIQVKIEEVGTSEVKYKKFSNLSGPAYVMQHTEIFMIKYETGDKDLFEKDKDTGKISIRHIEAEEQPTVNNPPSQPAKSSKPAPEPAKPAKPAAVNTATQNKPENEDKESAIKIKTEEKITVYSPPETSLEVNGTTYNLSIGRIGKGGNGNLIVEVKGKYLNRANLNFKSFVLPKVIIGDKTFKTKYANIGADSCFYEFETTTNPDKIILYDNISGTEEPSITFLCITNLSPKKPIDVRTTGQAAAKPAVQQKKNQTTLTVKEVTFEDFHVIESIDFVDESNREVDMPADWDEWFENATVKKDLVSAKTTFSLNPDGSFGKGHLTEGSQLSFIFVVNETDYHIGVGVGTQFITQKTGEGKYLLLPEETVALITGKVKYFDKIYTVYIGDIEKDKDGNTKVELLGNDLDDTLTLKNGEMISRIIMKIETAGRTIMYENYEVSNGKYVFTFATKAKPEKIIVSGNDGSDNTGITFDGKTRKRQ